MIEMNVIKGKSQHVNKWLWDTDLRTAALWQRVIIKSLQIMYAVIRDLRDGQLSLRAMSLVYTTVIAIVPFLALSFSVLKGFGLHNEVEPALLDSLISLGDKRFDIVSNVMGFIDNIKVGVLGAVGFALLIYSVISMMHKIEKSFNYTWQIKRDRNMSQRFRDYLSVIFVAPLMIFLSAAITTSANTGVVVTYIESLPAGSSFVSFISTLIPYLIMSWGFAFIYMFLPNTRVKLFPAFIGGLVTAIIWKLMGWGISTFVANSASSIAIYSAFASVIILMVWMYMGWLVLLIGASVSFYYQNPQYILIRRDNVYLNGEDSESLALSLLFLIGSHYQKNLAPWEADSIAKQLGVAPHLVDDMLDFLEALNYIVRAGESSVKIYPAQPVDKILVGQVLRQLREQGANRAGQQKTDSDIKGEKAVVHLLSDLRNLIDERFGKKTLKDIIDSNGQ
ncbi:MAG: YihY/virulence factor BrkB family protein [Cellvibrionales bacterium]|jgi:membrane protein|nr:YihY/virulence factor BrkB family protein [Cellvibrionales bacterium]